MLDMYLSREVEVQTKIAQRDELISLMHRLPVEELVRIHETGEIKLAFMDECMPSGEKTTWLDHFKGTALFAQAIALEEQEIQERAADQQRSEVEDQSRQESWRSRDALRLQKRLLELELAKQELQESTAETAAQPMPQTPGMGIPPGIQAGAQGAGAPGDVPPEAIGKMASILKAAKEKEDKKGQKLMDAIPASGRGRAFMETLGDAGMGGSRVGALMGGLGGAAHGAMTGQGAVDRVLRALGHGAIGTGAGALAGGLGNMAAAAPGAGVGAMTESPLVGAIGGGGVGYGLGKLLEHAAPGSPAAGIAPGMMGVLGTLGGVMAGHRASHAGGKRDEAEGKLMQHYDQVDDRELDGKKKHADIGSFLKGVAPAALEFAKKHPGAVIGGGLGAAHGLLHQGGGITSALAEGAGGAAIGHGLQSMAGNPAVQGMAGDASSKIRNLFKSQMDVPAMAQTMGKEGSTKVAFMAPILGALAGGAAKAGLGAAAGAAKGGIASGIGSFLKQNPMKAMGAGLGAVSNFAQSRANGQGLGSSLLSGAAGGAAGLG